MEIYLIRHTTPKIEKGICYGQSDIELADTFEKEAYEVIKKLPKTLDAVYSSPLKRCTQLASAIDPNYVADSRLKELNFGNWELKKWDDIPEDEISPWYNDWVNVPAKNGESYLQLFKRTSSFLEELESLNRIAIVTHAGVIRSISAYHNEIMLSMSFKEIKQVAYGEVVQLLIS